MIVYGVTLYHGTAGWLAAVVVAWRGGMIMAEAQDTVTRWWRGGELHV